MSLICLKLVKVILPVKRFLSFVENVSLNVKRLSFVKNGEDDVVSFIRSNDESSLIHFRMEIEQDFGLVATKLKHLNLLLVNSRVEIVVLLLVLF